MTSTELTAQIREFLSTRRARIAPDQAGLPAYGGNRRVKGLRCEEVAILTGVSVDYYARMDRGNHAGVGNKSDRNTVLPVGSVPSGSGAGRCPWCRRGGE